MNLCPHHTQLHYTITSSFLLGGWEEKEGEDVLMLLFLFSALWWNKSMPLNSQNATYLWRRLVLSHANVSQSSCELPPCPRELLGPHDGGELGGAVWLPVLWSRIRISPFLLGHEIANGGSPGDAAAAVVSRGVSSRVVIQ